MGFLRDNFCKFILFPWMDYIFLFLCVPCDCFFLLKTGHFSIIMWYFGNKIHSFPRFSCLLFLFLKAMTVLLVTFPNCFCRLYSLCVVSEFCLPYLMIWQYLTDLAKKKSLECQEHFQAAFFMTHLVAIKLWLFFRSDKVEIVSTCFSVFLLGNESMEPSSSPLC